jgi:hypothetical protein
MIDYGHLCLLVFAQGTWKQSYKRKLLDQIKEKFLSNMDIDDIDIWSEISKIPFFDPKNPKADDKPCELCQVLYKIFKGKKGENDGLILFSHNIIGWNGTGNFLSFLLGEMKVKKVYYLELDQYSYLTSTKNHIPEIINNIIETTINKTDFFTLLEKQELEFSILYEIGKF